MSLPPDVDPSGFLERAPRLAELFPDEALSAALAGGDAWAVHAALRRRLQGEPPGPLRELLAALVEDRSAFVVAGRPPSLGAVLGTGVRLSGRPSARAPDAPFVATRAVSVLGVPVWPLDEHLARRGADGTAQVIGQVPPSPRLRVWRGAFAAMVSVVLAVGVGVGAFVSHRLRVREVQVFNGLSRPVEVRIADQRWLVAPGARESGRILLGDEPPLAVATIPGELGAFEQVLMPVTERRLVFNVVGAARLMARPEGAIDSPASPGRLLAGSAGMLETGEVLHVSAPGWEQAARDLADVGSWRAAGDLAARVALADRSDTGARELAARCLLRADASAAAGFAWALARHWTDDVSAQHLAQDVLAATGKRSESVEHYEMLARLQPESVDAAVLALRARGITAKVEDYARVLERFPNAPVARHALARAQLLSMNDSTVRETLQPLEEGVPGTLEDLEQHVRVLIGSRRAAEAGTMVRRYGQDVRHRTWDFLVLAGRVAEAVGPGRTPYVLRDWIPAELARDPDRMLLLALLTGQRLPKDAQLAAMTSPTARAVATLTRDLLQKPEAALEAAVTASDSVLSRLEPDAAALMALELARRGDKRADRVFGASLPLLLAREPLVALVRRGEWSRDFQALAPGPRSAAYLVRVAKGALGDQGQVDVGAYLEARDTDMLGGLVPRATLAWYGEHPSDAPDLQREGAGGQRALTGRPTFVEPRVPYRVSQSRVEEAVSRPGGLSPPRDRPPRLHERLILWQIKGSRDILPPEPPAKPTATPGEEEQARKATSTK